MSSRGGDPIERFWDELIHCHGDLPALLRVVADRVVRLVGDGCVLTMVSRDGTRLDPVEVAHADPVARDAMRHVLGDQSSRIGEGIAGRVALDRRPVILNDIPAPVYEETTPERYHSFLRAHPMRALMVTPLVVGNELYGTLGAVRTESSRPYTEDDLATLRALGEGPHWRSPTPSRPVWPSKPPTSRPSSATASTGSCSRALRTAWC